MKSNLITRSGHDLLVAELQHLWHEERPEITKKVNWAASLGDRSENADYQYNKQLLRKIDRRVRYLGKRLEELRIIDYSPEQNGKVYFGAWVDIENDESDNYQSVLKFYVQDNYTKEERYAYLTLTDNLTGDTTFLTIEQPACI